MDIFHPPHKHECDIALIQQLYYRQIQFPFVYFNFFYSFSAPKNCFRLQALPSNKYSAAMLSQRDCAHLLDLSLRHMVICEFSLLPCTLLNYCQTERYKIVLYDSDKSRPLCSYIQLQNPGMLSVILGYYGMDPATVLPHASDTPSLAGALAVYRLTSLCLFQRQRWCVICSEGRWGMWVGGDVLRCGVKWRFCRGLHSAAF